MIPAGARQRISDFQAHVNGIATDLRTKGQAAWNGLHFHRTEPEIVHEFLSGIQYGTGYLNSVIAPMLSFGGRTVKFASVFIHQKPMVIGYQKSSRKPRPNASACELGDLKVVFLYLDKLKSILQCRSTIFQAKKAVQSGVYVISSNDQRLLYDESFGFDYRTVLPDTKRDFPKLKRDRERALQYLFIGAQPVRAKLIPASPTDGAYLDFGEYLLRFLNDSTGLEVAAMPKPRSKDWTRIAWDLFDKVAETTAGRRKTRNTGLQGILDHFNNFQDRAQFFLEGPPGHDEGGTLGFGGIPMLLIIVSDSELGDDRMVQALYKFIDGLVGHKPGTSSPGFTTQAQDNIGPHETPEAQAIAHNLQVPTYDSVQILLDRFKDDPTPSSRALVINELARRHGTAELSPTDGKLILDVLNDNYVQLDLLSQPDLLSLLNSIKSENTSGENSLDITL
jgi:hypothetical protein